MREVRRCLLSPRSDHFHSADKLWKDAASHSGGGEGTQRSSPAAKIRLSVLTGFYQEALGTAPPDYPQEEPDSAANRGGGCSEHLCLLHASLVVLSQALRVHLGESPAAVDSTATESTVASEFLGEAAGVLVMAAEALRMRALRRVGLEAAGAEEGKAVVAAWYDAVVPALGAMAMSPDAAGRGGCLEAQALCGQLHACWDRLHALSRRKVGAGQGVGAQCSCVLCKFDSCIVHAELCCHLKALDAKVLRLEGIETLKRSRDEAAGGGSGQPNPNRGIVGGVGGDSVELVVAVDAAEECFRELLWRIHGVLSGHRMSLGEVRFVGEV